MKAVTLMFALLCACASAKSNMTSASDTAVVTEGLQRLSSTLMKQVQEAAPLMVQASSMIEEGICAFAGFCRTNPAPSCEAVQAQVGVKGKTTALPDGKYWIKPKLADGSAAPTREIECMMSQGGGGWMLLFDERTTQEITQAFDPVVEQVSVTEVLAFTAEGPRAVQGAQSYLYNVDPSVLDHPSYSDVGRTMASVMNQPWVGQDGEGRRSNHNVTGISLYPNHAQHFRFKYLSRPAMTYGETMYVLDDGNIGPDECRAGPAAALLGTCYKDAPNASFPQTCYNSRGLLSFGCSNSADTFVHGCGTCVYRGYGSAEQAAHIRSTVIRRMYVR